MNRLLVALIGAAMWTACGGSEPAASTSTMGPSADASSGDASVTTGAGGSNDAGTVETSTPVEAGLDLDGVSLPDGPYAACAVCTLTMCQMDLAACAADPICRDGVTCSVTTCAQFFVAADAGAQLLPCLTTCFNGNLQTAVGAIGGVTCALSKCPACAGLADGGGGGD